MRVKKNIEPEITQHIATIDEEGTWKLELNKVAWGEYPPKWDIRKWNEDHTKCGKGLTLVDKEAEWLYAALEEIL